MNEPRILFIDIETSPILAHVWGLFKQNIAITQISEATEILCFGAKWYGEPKKKYIEGSQFHDGTEAMLQKLWNLFDEADIISGWNSNSFDLKHINRAFLMAGMPPPSPSRKLDLLLETRKTFKFASNKLQWVSTQLGLSGKEETGGFSTWIGCMQNDPKSWAMMLRYQRTDVLLLEDLYNRLLPWINTPNLALYADNDKLCPTCGVEDSQQKRGFYLTALGKYQRFVCTACGSWHRSKKNLLSVDQRSVFNN